MQGKKKKKPKQTSVIKEALLGRKYFLPSRATTREDFLVGFFFFF